MTDPLGYLLTWTTHGSWLHGDDRTSVARVGRSGPVVLDADCVRERFARLRLASQPLLLDPAARMAVVEAVHAHAEHRAWRIGALAVRTNHVHVVVLTPTATPERVMQELKSWSTRRLRHSEPRHSDQAIWTRHGSTRYLWKEEHVVSAIRYVREQGDRSERWRREPR